MNKKLNKLASATLASVILGSVPISAAEPSFMDKALATANNTWSSTCSATKYAYEKANDTFGPRLFNLCLGLVGGVVLTCIYDTYGKLDRLETDVTDSINFIKTHITAAPESVIKLENLRDKSLDAILDEINTAIAANAYFKALDAVHKSEEALTEAKAALDEAVKKALTDDESLTTEDAAKAKLKTNSDAAYTDYDAAVKAKDAADKALTTAGTASKPAYDTLINLKNCVVSLKGVQAKHPELLAKYGLDSAHYLFPAPKV